MSTYTAHHVTAGAEPPTPRATTYQSGRSPIGSVEFDGALTVYATDPQHFLDIADAFNKAAGMLFLAIADAAVAKMASA